MNFTIKNMWDGYAEAVLGPAPHPTQYQEMRKAYYAGFITCLRGLRHAVGHPDVDEGDGVKTMISLNDEYDKFLAEEVERYTSDDEI